MMGAASASRSLQVTAPVASKPAKNFVPVPYSNELAGTRCKYREAVLYLSEPRIRT
jgi:hypothetical protein